MSTRSCVRVISSSCSALHLSASATRWASNSCKLRINDSVKELRTYSSSYANGPHLTPCSKWRLKGLGVATVSRAVQSVRYDARAKDRMVAWRRFASTDAAGSAASGSSSSRSGWTSWTAQGLLLLAIGAAGYYQGRRMSYLDTVPVSTQTLNNSNSNTGPRYADEATTQRAISEIRNLLGEDAVSTESSLLESHSHSEWSTSNSPTRPVAIVFPSSTSDVSALARIAYKYRIPLIPYGAGSSVEGNFAAPHGGITVSFAHMDRILAIHEDDMDAVLQPGVVWTDLNEELASRESGLWLPLDPSPTASVGGMVSTNCSGTNAVRYGTMRDWVVNVTVVLADEHGTVIKTRRRPRKSSAGYDLTRLFVGAEGTLGMVTEVTVKLASVPRFTGVATVSFPAETPKDGVDRASQAAVRIIREGIQVAALEVMDEAQMRVINRNGGTLRADGKTKRLWDEAVTLFIKLSSSSSERALSDDAARVKEVVSRYGGGKLQFATTEDEKDAIWRARKDALFAMVAQRDPGTSIWSTDTAVPLSRLAEIITLSKEESSQLGLFNTVMGHVGDGNFHQSVMYNADDPEEVAKVKNCVRRMMKRALDMDGTVSGEHAIGIGKKKELEEEVGEATMGLMRAVKGTLDPRGIMNPGKVFDLK